jgi:hypothetical protein
MFDVTLLLIDHRLSVKRLSHFVRPQSNPRIRWLTDSRCIPDTPDVLSNEDLAELLESTRQRIAHMGGDAPAAAGVAHVLDGLIAMLREQAPTSESLSPAEQAPAPEVEPASEAELAAEPEPAQSPRVPVRFRRQETDAAHPNPLLRPQYSDFFKKLIADQKAPAKQDEPNAAATEESPEATPAPPAPPPRSNSGFVDETATG